MTILYNLGPLYQWRFATKSDEDWMEECRDSKFSLAANGYSTQDFGIRQCIGETEEFLWHNHDHYPDETVDFDFYERKHGKTAAEALVERNNSIGMSACLIFVDRATGADLGFRWYEYRKVVTGLCDHWSIRETHIGTWIYHTKAFALHPTARGQGHSEMLQLFTSMGLERSTAPRGDGSTLGRVGGYLILFDPWEVQGESGVIAGDHQLMKGKDGTIYTSMADWWLNETTLTTEAPKVDRDEQLKVEQLNDGRLPKKWVCVHALLSPIDPNDPELPKQLLLGNWTRQNVIEDLSIDPENGKLYYNGSEQDETKTVQSWKKYMKMYWPTRTAWVDSKFY